MKGKVKILIPIICLMLLFNTISSNAETIKNSYKTFPGEIVRQTHLYDSWVESFVRPETIAPQKVSIVQVVGDFYAINTWIGVKFVPQSTVKLADEIIFDNIIEIKETTKLYHSPNEAWVFDTGLTIEPQEIYATARIGDWYYLDIPLGEPLSGEYWVHSPQTDKEYISKLTLLENTKLYSDKTEGYLGTIAPQEVNTIKRDGNLFQINTWMGPCWIKPTNYIEGTIKRVDERVYFPEYSKIHNLPKEGNYTGTGFSAQTVHILARYTDSNNIDWCLVKTWLGEKWVEDQTSYYEQVEEYYSLSKHTPIYDSDIKTTYGGLSPQKIKSIGRADTGWLIVNTWLGPKWMPSTYATPDSPPTDELRVINNYIKFNNYTKIYNQAHRDTYSGSGFSPQSVYVYKSWSNWYLIQTWLGQKWVMME